ncbi:hypothetical protein [Henriciella sp.]|uniref:hypothetical protein n=1 Tax=Henriciella sp. TaxID=1968823 RepID=UPI0017D64B64|nr:hypothetical protein [Henriciella sp.]HIG23692.1 hypothetical protein [Henriciella sp.]
MSDSWDEKHARNKGAAKNAFEEKASDAPKEEPSSDLLKALEGLNDRRSGVPDRRNSDIHRMAQELEKLANRNPESGRKDQPAAKDMFSGSELTHRGRNSNSEQRAIQFQKSRQSKRGNDRDR